MTLFVIDCRVVEYVFVLIGLGSGLFWGWFQGKSVVYVWGD